MAKRRLLVTRGAPEVILARCAKFWPGIDRGTIEREIENQGRAGRRVIAVAARHFAKRSLSAGDERGLEFIGLLVFRDPLKASSKKAIEMARKLRVDVKIITGDSIETAAAVGREVGLIDDNRQVVDARELEVLPAREFEQACRRVRVFARATPAAKYRIVEALERRGEVGFLGEGINDVPSLRAANVGLVVDQATDAAKAEADIVILSRDLKVIVEGIRLGRTVFSNVQKYIKCTLASNSGGAVFMALASLAVPFLPMLPLQILLINVLSDFVLIAIIYDAVEPRELLAPKSYHLGQMLPLAGILALVSVAFGFVFLAVFGAAPAPEFQTLWFVASVAGQTALIFSVRTSGDFWRAKRPGRIMIALALLVPGIAASLPFLPVGQKVFGMAPPRPENFALMALLVAGYFMASESAKRIYYRFALGR